MMGDRIAHAYLIHSLANLLYLSKCIMTLIDLVGKLSAQVTWIDLPVVGKPHGAGFMNRRSSGKLTYRL